MPNMFRRARNNADHSEDGSSLSPTSGGGSNTATGFGGGRKSTLDRASRRSSAPSSRTGPHCGQWWRGALTGAVVSLAIVYGRSALNQSSPTIFLEVSEDRESKNNEEKARCPVFNGVTGEVTIPGTNPPEKIKGFIKPRTSYPIQSREWKDRVNTARASKSRTSKGASADEIGRAALNNRLRLSAMDEKKAVPAGAASMDDNRIPERKDRCGIGAVLTLSVGSKPDVYSSILGTGWGVDSEQNGETLANEGEPVTWAEIVVCDSQELGADAQRGVGDEHAWLKAREKGAIKEVDCGNVVNANNKQNVHGELQLACAAGDASSTAEWLWIPGSSLATTISSSANAGGGQGMSAKLVNALHSLAVHSDVNGVFGLLGWVRPAQKPGKPGWGKGKWEFITGDAEEEEETGTDGIVEEVDALIDGMFIRATDLRFACGLIRGKNPNKLAHVHNHRQRLLQEGIGIEARRPAHNNNNNNNLNSEFSETRRRLNKDPSGGKVGIIDESMKLSAVSYVLRRTMGVRSYVLRSGGSWGYAGGQMRGGAPTWWSWLLEGSSIAEIGPDKNTVPGSELLPTDCLTASTREPVVLVAASVEDLNSLQPLLTAFYASDVYDPYVVVPTFSIHSLETLRLQWLMQDLAVEQFGAIKRDNSGTTNDSKIRMRYGTCGTMLTDVSLEGTCSETVGMAVIVNGETLQLLRPRRSSTRSYPEEEAESSRRRRGLQEFMWAEVLSRVSPVAVVALGGHGRGHDGGDSEGERAARRACEQAETPIAYIRMPTGDAPHAMWLTRLAPEALASWARPRFSVSVITNDRSQSLRRLLQSLTRSRLFGDELSVDFYVESSADDATLQTVEAFSEFWGDRGQVQTHFRVLKGGLIRAVTESFYPADIHHHGFLLEDDIEVSPHFFAWAKFATLTYQYGAPQDFARDMYGVSLYTPRVNEIYKKRIVYDSNKVISRKTSGGNFSPYLHQTPCSWGAVYFPEIWMEYRLYLGARLREDHVLVMIRNSKTNNWKTSWKRFYIEMAYQAQYYMLYPNYYNQTSFATNWLEAGEHIKEVPLERDGDNTDGSGKTKAVPAVKPKGDRGHRPEDYTVPLMADGNSLVDPLPRGRLPSLAKLPRLDVLNNDVKP